MNAQRSLVCLLSVFLLLAARPTRAADAPEDAARAEAKERFARGLHLFENGDNGGALAEFKRAYDLVPNRLALYNIALVYASMGKPVEAVESLDKVLADPGPLKPEYLDRARATKEEQERCIGLLSIQVNVPAAIEIDGVKVADAPRSQPLRVAAGEHIVGALAPGYLPTRRTLTLAGQARAEESFDLQPTEAHLAHVEVHCPLPGAEVLVDGAVVGKTPLPASVAVAPGARIVELRRAGYKPLRRELPLTDGARGEVDFDPEEDTLVDARRGQLRLLASEGDVLVTVDGRPRGMYRQAIGLPAGPHRVKLEQAGYESMERLLDVPAGGESTITVALRPTVETRATYLAKARAYRHWAYGTLASGALLAAGSTGMALWSNGKLSDSRTTLNQVEQNAVFRGGGTCDRSYALTDAQIAACDQSLADAQNNVDKYRNLRTAGFIGAGAGAALIGVGVTLWIIGPDPNRYDHEERYAGLVPVLTAGPDGASVALHGRF